MYCQWVPLYPPVGITRWTSVVPEGTRVPDKLLGDSSPTSNTVEAEW